MPRQVLPPATIFQNLLKELVASGLVATADTALRNKVIILQRIKEAEVSLSSHGQTMLEQAFQNANMGFFGNMYKKQIVESVGQAMESLTIELEQQTDVLFSLVVTAAQTYAAQITKQT